MKKADNFDAKQWLVENKITFQSRLNENKIEGVNVEVDDNMVTLSGDSGDYDGFIEDDGTVSFSITYDDMDEEFNESNWKDILSDNHVFVKVANAIDNRVEALDDYVQITVKASDLTSMNETRLNEEAKKPSIKVLKDIYYFDKLSGLGTKDDVDEKYHDKAKLVFKKGKTVKDDTKYDDSEYEMITSSKRLTKGTDYSI